MAIAPAGEEGATAIEVVGATRVLALTFQKLTSLKMLLNELGRIVRLIPRSLYDGQ